MKTYKEVNQDLKLEDTSDWGIINDDADRVKEFILYYNSNCNLIEEYVKSGFIELICSSMNEAIIENKIDDELLFLFSEYLCGIEQTEYNLMLIAYWATLESSDVDFFPVADLIQKIMDFGK